MILQSENPIRMVRELKGAPLSIMMVLFYVHQRVSLQYLVDQTGYTDKPIRSGLHYLQEAGLVDETSAGWQLVKENVRQLPLTLQLEDEITADKEENAPTQKADPIQSDEVQKCRNNSGLLNYLNTVVVEDINNLNTSTSTVLNLSDKSGKIPDLEEIKQVLGAAASLFGREIMGDLAEYANIDRLLSWIAQAYRGCYEQGRLKIQNPAGLVYWAFHQGKDKTAEKKYLDTNRLGRYLPESFMKASGQWDFEDEDNDHAQQ